MPRTAVEFVIVEPCLTAVAAQTTTWAEFPSTWGRLLGEVYGLSALAPISQLAAARSCGRT